MSTKDLAIETIRDLPVDATWRDIENRIRFVAGVEEGLQAVRDGKVVPHEEVRKLLAEWTGR